MSKRLLVSGILAGSLVFCLPQGSDAGDGGGRHHQGAGGGHGRDKDGSGQHRQRADNQGEAESRRENRVDKREANQERRIAHGIARGYLTAEETAKLQGLEANIANAEAGFKADGKITRDEGKQLRQMLDDASAQIWAEKHDTDGKEMPVRRLGRQVYAKSELTARIEHGDYSRAEARSLMQDLRQAAAAKRRLANEDLSAEDRAKLQARYDAFMATYAETR